MIAFKKYIRGNKTSILFWFFIGVFSVFLQAQEEIDPPSIEEQIFEQIGPLTLLELAPLSREEMIEKLKTDLNIHIKTPELPLFDRYFLSYIYNYFSSMKPDSLHIAPYNLYAQEHHSQKLVSLRSENNLYFSQNAGDHTITKSVQQVMDAVFNQEVLPDEIRVTFEYNNELYAQLNEAVLSSEDIKNFINKHSGIVFVDESNSNAKPFSRKELLMVLKQYLDLPVHIRDNLALKRVVRVENSFSIMNMFSTVYGKYSSSTETITLTDSAFQKINTDDKGEETFLHEIGHALWGKSIWKGLSSEAKKEYEKLSWQGSEQINDEFISNYSAVNIREDFAEHFSAYINNSEQLKHEVAAKYQWLKEYIFLNVEYIPGVAGHLKIFVESEHGDTTPPYFVDSPQEAVKINMSVDESQEDYWRNGSANIKVEVSRLFDDSSEIKHIGILLQSKNDYFWVNSPKDFKFCSIDGMDDWESEASKKEASKKCMFLDPHKPGWYAFYTSKKLALSYPGDYKITQIKLEDKAGNKKTLRSKLGSAVFPFPGTRDKVEEEARKEEERLAGIRRRLERGEAKKEEEARRKKAAQEAKDFNVLNLSENPIRLYQSGEELRILEFGQCLSMMENELPFLSLETTNEWFDDLICSNTDEDAPRCWIGSTSLVKQNEDEEYVLVDYKNEFSADFSRCLFSPAKKEEQGRKARLKRISEEITGFNIVNLSDEPVRVYQSRQGVLDMEPGQCLRLTESEMSSLSLHKKGSFFSWTPICSNVGNSLNTAKCEVHSASLVKQNADGKYILTDYQGEKSADFYQCSFLTTEIQSVLGNLAEKARRKRAAQSAEGFNILNLSENPVRLEQDEEELRTLEFGECISMAEKDLSSLRLKVISGWFDWELDTFICSNTDEDQPQCRINTASLIKKDENGYVLTDYQDEFSADFRRCSLSPSRKEESDRKIRMKQTSAETFGFNIVNLSDESVRVYQGHKAVLDLKPQKCVRMTEQELLDLTLRKADSFICTNIENSLNIYKCNITSASLVQQNEDGEYMLTDYQGEESADFSSCTPLTEDEGLVSKDKREQNLSENTPKKEEETKELDRTPPYFMKPADESISVSRANYYKKNVFVKVEVNGLFDDSSEINNIKVLMRSKNDYFWLNSPSSRLCSSTDINRYYNECIFIDPDQPGHYVYYDKELRRESYPGDYRIAEVKVYDTQGNWRRVYSFDDHSDINFPGTRLLVNEIRMRDDLEIQTSTTAHGDTVAHILTTDMSIFERNMLVSIINTESEEEYKYEIYVAWLSSLNTHFKSPDVSGKMSLPIVIPKELKSGKYRLNWIAFEYGQNDYYVHFYESNPNNYFDHISNEENSAARPVVDDIVMRVLKGENKRGGDTSIKIDIPIEGLDRGDGKIEFIVRTPTGDRRSYFASLNSTHDGSTDVSVLMHLPPRHAEGEYMITHITTTEDYSSAVNRRIDHRGLNLREGVKSVHRERLLERKIRTTLEISTPPPSQKETKH